MLLRTTGKADAFRVGIDRIAEDRISKFVGPTAAVEFEKACAVERALAGSPFSTPKPLGYDVDAGRVEFEYVPHAERLLEVIQRAYHERDLALVLDLNRRAAEMLCLLHAKLKLNSAVHWTPPEYLVRSAYRSGRDLATLDQVYLHCDFSPVNVLVKPNADLVVIDHSPNYYFTHRTDLIGPRFVSFANYTSKLFWPFRFSTYTSSRRCMAHVLRSEFIAHYEKCAGITVDRTMLCIFERSLVKSFINWKTQVNPVRWVANAMSRVALPSINA